MEMSMGTIVTIVLLMSVLVLGIFLVQKIFSSGSSAIDQIDSQLQSKIGELFADEGLEFVLYPRSAAVNIKRGESGKGFGFAVDNTESKEKSYTWSVTATDAGNWKEECGLSVGEANKYLILEEGSFELGKQRNNLNTGGVIIKLNIPKDAPRCTIPYKLSVKESEAGTIAGPTVFVTIK